MMLDRVFFARESHFAFGFLVGVLLAGCNPDDGSCEAGQAGCECVQGQCASGLECFNGLCYATGNDDNGEVGEETGELPGEECPGTPLDSSGALDLDLGVVTISGNVTLNGQAMPDWTQSRGAIELTEIEQGLTTVYTLGATGPASYALTVPPGNYEVSFRGNSQACPATPTPAFPCNRGVLLSSVMLDSSGALDLDVEAVTIVGAVSLNGAALPNTSSSRGQIGFVSETSPIVHTADFGTGGAGNYSITLVPGSYDVRWVGNAANCGASPLVPVPCNIGEIATDLNLQQSGNLDLDVPGVTISGQVNVNGGAMPSDVGNRGSIKFENGFGPVRTAGFGASGPANYEISLVADDYEVIWDGEETLCVDASAVPCNDGTLLPNQALTQSGALDLDVNTASISGSVTINGAPMPDEAGLRGALRFTGVDGRVAISDSFGSTGPASYAITLVAGTYIIGLDGNINLCDAASPVGVPCMYGALLELDLSQDGLVDVDVPTVQVSGIVSVGGQGMPDWNTDRGLLRFARTSDPVLEVALSNKFGTAGVGSYRVTLIAGTYDIGWKAELGACDQGAAPVPCADGPVLPGVDLESSGALDLDIDVISVSGAVTLESATMPTESSDRGRLMVRHVGEVPANLPSFGSTGPVNYAISLLPGDYVIAHLANQLLCGEGAQPQVPCGSQVLLGCE